MNKIEALVLLREEQKNEDWEIAHSNADDILCKFLLSLGYEDIVREYNLINKWYA